MGFDLNLFNDTVNFMSTTNNIVQFIAFLMAVFAILYIFSIKYAKPLVKLLYPIGFKKCFILKVLFLCRKNPRKYIRIFCEYNILKSQGEHRDVSWWRKTHRDFVAFLKDSAPDNFIYEIDNCTDILCEGISLLINDYFDYFDDKDVRKKYDLNRVLPITFCMEIKIHQGFLSPNFLLSGLLDRYKNDWGNLVRKYISSAGNEKYSDELYASEIYYTFAWLLWGPSYQLKHQEGSFKLCQYAFGDESNSINVVLNNEDKLMDLWSEIWNNSNGVLCSLTCKLYKARKYIDFHRECFSPFNTYFTNKVSDESTGFLLEPVDFDITKGYKAVNYYCTAYVWIMFESVADESDSFQPQRAITFFEHANLANRINYEACINSLISKSFAHFDRMFSEKSVHRKYRYCLSMNETIEKSFFEQLKMKMQGRDELAQKYRDYFFTENLYTEREIFGTLDAYFSDVDNEFGFFEVRLEDKNSIALLGEYYTSIYIGAFPDMNERESLDSIMDYLGKKNTGWYGDNNYHIYLATKAGKVVAGLICDYFAASNCGVIEFVAVKEEFQSEGIGSKIYQKAVELLRKDSKRVGRKDLDYVFCEIEKAEAFNGTAPQKYLHFWDKMGYRKVDLHYFQPAIGRGKEGVSSLDLVVLPVNREITGKSGINANTVKSFLLDYARFAMRIEKPMDDIYINKMLEGLNSRDSTVIGLDRIANERV